MISKDQIIKNLDIMYPNPVCELVYIKDYELLIATVLSAHSTDKIVNKVTKVLFDKYDIFSLANTSLTEIENIIRPIGSYTRKARFIKEIAKRLVDDFNGVVPNNGEYLESLPGVGHKTANVVLSNLFHIPTIAVDTHVSRVAVRLFLAKKDDKLITIENNIRKSYPKEKWNRLNDQLVLFGRYTCKSVKPKCEECLFQNKCNLKEKHYQI